MRYFSVILGLGIIYFSTCETQAAPTEPIPTKLSNVDKQLISILEKWKPENKIKAKSK